MCHAVLMLIVIAASVLAMIAWLYLLAGHGGFWRTDQRLPPGQDGDAGQDRDGGQGGDVGHDRDGGQGGDASPDGTAPWPGVVAVVPARNEAAILPQTLPTLLAQDYPGPLSIVLVDDESSDGTAAVAVGLDRAARRDGGGARPARSVLIVQGEPTPPGWAGKVWAMAQGGRAAGDAEYLLFTDADIGYAAGTLTALVRAARSGDRVLVSQMALLRADSFAERLLIPAFVYFFAMLYPFRRVNSRGARTAAAAGGCMLVRREALAAVGGLDRIRSARIDDVALGRLLKRDAAGACWLGFTADVTSRRQYRELGEVWDMVARSAYTQLRYSAAALAGTVVGLAWLYLMPVAAALAGLDLLIGGTSRGGETGAGGHSLQQAAWLAAAGLAGWALMSVTYLPMLRLYRLSLLRAPTLPLIAVLYAAMTVSSARRHHAGRGGEWKGRTIPAGRPRA
jgi:hopene-associated glycosyltransferase HpnB